MHALLTLGLVPLLAASVGWNGNVSKIKCNQPIPEFTGDAGVKISRSQARLLCTCIWDKVEVGGWERDALRQISNGQDPGFIKRQGVISRFRKAVLTCEKKIGI